MNTTVDQADFFRALAEKSSGRLRGDYSGANEHYVVAQQWSAYTPQQHALWRRLYQRQMMLLPDRACDIFIYCLKRPDAAAAIPDLAQVSESLHRTTAWRLVAVPGLVPELTFFEHLANRRFPVTVWLREPEEFDYIAEPDIFHDFFGHVPLLFDPVFADQLQQFGRQGMRALELDALRFMARAYWYTVEFGLMQTPQGLRAYGAGLLSSGGEIEYCLTDPAPRRLVLDIERAMRTLYKIDSYQETYFVIRDFRTLFDGMARDFGPVYERLGECAALEAGSLLPGERNLPPNRANQPISGGDGS